MRLFSKALVRMFRSHTDSHSRETRDNLILGACEHKSFRVRPILVLLASLITWENTPQKVTWYEHSCKRWKEETNLKCIEYLFIGDISYLLYIVVFSNIAYYITQSYIILCWTGREYLIDYIVKATFLVNHWFHLSLKRLKSCKPYFEYCNLWKFYSE